MGRVLVLGAGLVCGPLVKYLVSKGYAVTVASRTVARAQELCTGLEGATPLEMDLEQPGVDAALDRLVQEADAVVSMLPYLLHPKVAEVAIRHKKHFLTTSYTSDALRALDSSAQEAGVVMINECGVDPGTDHMSAMAVIDDVHEKGGKIIEFTSFCGGLPSPRSKNNPLGYKFSWAPRGVLLASRNPARFLQNGEPTSVESSQIFASPILVEIPVSEGGQTSPVSFDCVFNRDCTPYRDIYKIPEVQKLVRGTMRYPGWCEVLYAMGRLGLLDIEERPLADLSYAAMMASLVNGQDGTVKNDVARFLGVELTCHTITTFEWLGLFSADKITAKTRLDSVCELMKAKESMYYREGEVDMLVMKHTLVASYPDRTDVIESVMVDLGKSAADTSMSKLVALPVAIACHLLLSGQLPAGLKGLHPSLFSRPIDMTGLVVPVEKFMYQPILRELEAAIGVKWVETVRPQ